MGPRPRHEPTRRGRPVRKQAATRPRPGTPPRQKVREWWKRVNTKVAHRTGVRRATAFRDDLSCGRPAPLPRPGFPKTELFLEVLTMVSKHNERHIYESSINGCDWGSFFPLVLASTPLLSCKIQYPFLAASTLCTYGESHGWTSLVTWLDE